MFATIVSDLLAAFGCFSISVLLVLTAAGAALLYLGYLPGLRKLLTPPAAG